MFKIKETISILDVAKTIWHTFLTAINFTSFEAIIKNLAIISWTFLAPVRQAILAVYFLIALDLITGVWAAIKRKEPVTSSGLSRTIGKILIYSTTIIVAFIVHQYLLVGFELPIEALVSGFIAITETKSIFENLDKISKNKVLKDLIIILSNERNKRIPPKE